MSVAVLMVVIAAWALLADITWEACVQTGELPFWVCAIATLLAPVTVIASVATMIVEAARRRRSKR